MRELEQLKPKAEVGEYPQYAIMMPRIDCCSARTLLLTGPCGVQWPRDIGRAAVAGMLAASSQGERFVVT